MITVRGICPRRGLAVATALVAVGAVLLFAGLARAESARLEEAAALVSEADFERALGVLEELFEAESLSRAEVVMMLELLGLVHHALGNERQLEQALRQLGALDEGHQFGATAPPALVERFRELREGASGPLALEVEAQRIRGGFQIEAEVTGDEGHLLRGTVISTRIPGGEWVRTEGRRASIPVRGEGAVEYYVEALGPGGVVALSEGSEAEPLMIGTPDEDPVPRRVERSIRDAAEDPVGRGEDDDGRRVSPWVWVGVSLGVLAVAGGVVAAVLLTRDASNTQLGSPEVDWP